MSDDVPNRPEPPLVRLAVLCEDVDESADGRPAILRFPVHTLQFPGLLERNYEVPGLVLYLQLQGGSGTFDLRVRMRRVDGVREVTVSPTYRLILATPGDAVPLELALKLNHLVFPNPDVYELMV